MYKAKCLENECINKDIVYYLPEVTEKVVCGGCKAILDAAEMSQQEFNQVFDYDPFAISPIGLE
jgi:hypothetical protein